MFAALRGVVPTVQPCGLLFDVLHHQTLEGGNVLLLFVIRDGSVKSTIIERHNRHRGRRGPRGFALAWKLTSAWTNPDAIFAVLSYRATDENC